MHKKLVVAFIKKKSFLVKPSINKQASRYVTKRYGRDSVAQNAPSIVTNARATRVNDMEARTFDGSADAMSKRYLRARKRVIIRLRVHAVSVTCRGYHNSVINPVIRPVLLALFTFIYARAAPLWLSPRRGRHPRAAVYPRGKSIGFECVRPVYNTLARRYPSYASMFV